MSNEKETTEQHKGHAPLAGVNGSEEAMIISMVRDFFLLSGAMENDFCVNDFNTDYTDSVIDEQCFISVSVHCS